MLKQCRCASPNKVVSYGQCSKFPDCIPPADAVVTQLRAENERLKAVVDAYERDNNANIQTIVDLKARLGEPSSLRLKTSAELALTELHEAAEAVEQMWRDFTSQEMYGEMLRDGMDWSSENEPGDPSDYERWDDAHTKLRAVLAKVQP